MAAADSRLNLLIVSVLAACCCAVSAQTVYRCGPQANQYSQHPCEAGKAIDVGDPRSADQLAQARKAGAEQQKLVLQMTRERRNNERTMRPPLAGGIDFRRGLDAAPPTTKAGKTSRKSRQGTAEPLGSRKEFSAIEPGSLSKKRNKPQD